MNNKRIKKINTKLFLCLMLASVFYIIGVASVVKTGVYNHDLFRVFVISFVLLCISFIASNFLKGYIPAFIMSTFFILTTFSAALLYNSCIVLIYLTILLAIISIYQNIYLMTYIFILSFIATYVGESIGHKMLNWDHNESGLLPFILAANILGVFLSYRQIKKDNEIRYKEIEESKKQVDLAYQNIIDIGRIVSDNSSCLVDKASSNQNDTRLVLNSITEIIDALANQNESILVQANSSSTIQTKLEEVQNLVYNMSTYIDSAMEVTSKNESNMENLIKNTDTVNEIALNSQTSIEKLYQQVSEVQSVVDIITSIAEETNLLSLNANIEASKAGTFGAGFTVVATEIRKLSDSTTNSIQKINHMLQSLLDNTEKVNNEIIQMNSAFNNQKKEIQHTNQNISELIKSMDLLRSGLSNVITSTDDVVSSNTEVTESITNLSAISEEISATLETINVACEGVLNLSTDTLEIAKSVDTKVKEISS